MNNSIEQWMSSGRPHSWAGVHTYYSTPMVNIGYLEWGPGTIALSPGGTTVKGTGSLDRPTGFYFVKTKERIFRVYFNTVKMPQCSVPGCTEMGANYMHFTWWRGLFFFPTRAHSFFSTPLTVGEWSMTDIHSHETNPKQLTQWWAPIRRELMVLYHGGATWGDFSAGTSLVPYCKCELLTSLSQLLSQYNQIFAIALGLPSAGNVTEG